MLIVILAFVGIIFLGRFSEYRRKKKVLGRLFNVLCPGCLRPFGDNHYDVVEKIKSRGIAPHNAGPIPMTWRIQCRRCGHMMVYEG
jgi:hypothetical protein